MDKQRVIVYIDGFNFYYGLKKDVRWKKYYWLDIVKLFEMFMRPNQELVAVKYFSARVDDIDQSLRQSAFFQANKENPMRVDSSNAFSRMLFILPFLILT